jgi:2-hydroxycyclohexanecarboxyl-CoA dehydrogenase
MNMATKMDYKPKGDYIKEFNICEKGCGQVEGKVVIITGTTCGIGQSVAIRLAEQRAKLIMTGIEPEVGKQNQDFINDHGGEATYINADSFEQNEIKAMVAQVMDKYGRIDVLINNAGYHIATHFEDATEDQFWQMVNIHGLAHCFTMWEVLPIMQSQRSGSVINFASKAATRPSDFEPFYCLAKAGILQLTKCLNMEYGPSNIRVNCVSPGATITAMTQRPDGSFVPGFAELAENFIPLRRHAMPLDIAKAVLWLASDESAYVAGLNLNVDGGIVV